MADKRWKVDVRVDVDAPDQETANARVYAVMHAALALGRFVGFSSSDPEAEKDAVPPSTNWYRWTGLGWFRLDNGVLQGAPSSLNDAGKDIGPNVEKLVQIDLAELQGRERATMRRVRMQLESYATQENGEQLVSDEENPHTPSDDEGVPVDPRDDELEERELAAEERADLKVREQKGD